MKYSDYFYSQRDIRKWKGDWNPQLYIYFLMAWNKLRKMLKIINLGGKKMRMFITLLLLFCVV